MEENEYTKNKREKQKNWNIVFKVRTKINKATDFFSHFFFPLTGDYLSGFGQQ